MHSLWVLIGGGEDEGKPYKEKIPETIALIFLQLYNFINLIKYFLIFVIQLDYRNLNQKFGLNLIVQIFADPGDIILYISLATELQLF